MTVAPGVAAAQIRASERGSVSQEADGTTITIDYGRPSAKGRALFGGIVHWDALWTPGANWATTLKADKNVSIDGHALPAGTYSVWAIPRAARWTIVLAKTAQRFHTNPPPSDDEQLRFDVRPDSAATHVEMLTWTFPEVRADTIIARMQWGTMSVPLRIVVPGSP